jgi:hypothetical protein
MNRNTLINENSPYGSQRWLDSSVADPDPGSGAFLTPGSGIRNRFFPDPGFRISDPGSKTHIFDNFLAKKFFNSLKIDPNFFLQTFKNKIISNFVKFVAIRKGMTKKIFHPSLLLLILDPGSGMGKNQDPG